MPGDDFKMEDTPPVDCEFSLGDIVTYTNEYGVSFTGRRIIGFRHEPFNGRFIYLDKGSWWFPVKPEELSTS